MTLYERIAAMTNALRLARTEPLTLGETTDMLGLTAGAIAGLALPPNVTRQAETCLVMAGALHSIVTSKRMLIPMKSLGPVGMANATMGTVAFDKAIKEHTPTFLAAADIVLIELQRQQAEQDRTILTLISTPMGPPMGSPEQMLKAVKDLLKDGGNQLEID